MEKLGDATAIGSSGQHVWHPAPPQPDVVTILPHTIDATVSQPTFIINMDFGGPSGSLLPLLTRVAIFHDDINHNVRGLGFYYNDGTEREFGFREFLTDYRCRDTALEASVAIGGPAGERIVGITFFLHSITVRRTNHSKRRFQLINGVKYRYIRTLGGGRLMGL